MLLPVSSQRRHRGLFLIDEHRVQRMIQREVEQRAVAGDVVLVRGDIVQAKTVPLLSFRVITDLACIVERKAQPRNGKAARDKKNDSTRDRL